MKKEVQKMDVVFVDGGTDGAVHTELLALEVSGLDSGSLERSAADLIAEAVRAAGTGDGKMKKKNLWAWVEDDTLTVQVRLGDRVQLSFCVKADAERIFDNTKAYVNGHQPKPLSGD